MMNYKYAVGDEVTIVSYIGGDLNVTVFSRYQSDGENHPSSQQHNRYVCYDSLFNNSPQNLHDVSESELQRSSPSVKERLNMQGLEPWSEDGSKWIVTYLSRSVEGVCDAVFDTYKEAYEFAKEIMK